MSLPKLKLFIRNSYFSIISVVETHFSSKKKKKKIGKKKRGPLDDGLREVEKKIKYFGYSICVVFLRMKIG